MSSFYNCNLFNLKFSNLENFSFEQEEILLRDYNKSTKSSSFNKLNVKYFCKFKEYKNLDWNKPTGIIPIKDNKDLLEFTLKNLSNNNVFEYINFIIVDDRSEDNIKDIVKKYPVSYLRVDNKKGFNFSSLNNIAAKIASDKGSKQIVLWNSDLWVDSEDTVPSLLKLHKDNNSTISGTKLLYPAFSWNGEEVSHNISSIFPDKVGSYRGTIQFGGGLFIFSEQFKNYFPIHYSRFKEKNFFKSNVNKLCNFVTGAFQIIDLEWYINNGGLNPSLSKNFQDVDICLRASEQNKKVYYFGENIYMLHDESVSLSKEKSDKQFLSDHILYSKIWNIQRFYSLYVQVKNGFHTY